jgi:hypothetical protein
MKAKLTGQSATLEKIFYRACLLDIFLEKHLTNANTRIWAFPYLCDRYSISQAITLLYAEWYV